MTLDFTQDETGQYRTYVRNRFVDENTFLTMEREDAAPPKFAEVSDLLPRPTWAGHASAVECYWKAWEIAFRNLRQPTAQSGFVANFIDSAFCDDLFMWDSAFILFFGRYGERAFNFQRTLDNFYARQHPDGFICRQIRELDGRERFARFDIGGTGPNVLAWCEWDYSVNAGDRERLARVFPVLVAYHQWLRMYRSWPDGSYWSSGWDSGMDNQPRVPQGYHVYWSHGFTSWIDACVQQALSGKMLLNMAETLGRTNDIRDCQEEIERLSAYANEHMWDEAAAFYYDRFRDGGLSDVKTIGAYWALLAGVVPQERLGRFVAHLDNPEEFKRRHRVPSLSADHPMYHPDGRAWLGAVWSPTNYMVLRGLTSVGLDGLAHEIATNHVDSVVRVYEKTGTLWENYAPDSTAPGQSAKRDFVGWAGLPPIAVLFEYVFGLRPNVPKGRLVWDVRLLEEHGVSQYPFGEVGLLDVRCAARSTATERPRVKASSSVPVVLEVRWEGGRESIPLQPE